MPSSSTEHLRLRPLAEGTLAAFTALRQMPPVQAEAFAARYRDGKLEAQNYAALERDGVPVAAFGVSRPRRRVMVMVSLADPLLAAELRFALAALRERLQSSPVTLLVARRQSAHDLTPLHADFLTLTSHAVLHSTPLTNLPAFSTVFEEFGLETLASPEFAAFLARAPGEFTQSGLLAEYGEAEHFGGLLRREGGEIVAAGAASEVRPGTASIQMIGVREDWRGRGLGRELHAALMHRAATFAGEYDGATDADNAPMRRILAANGCRMNDEQWQYAVDMARLG